MSQTNETRQRVTGGLEDMSIGVDPSSIPQKAHVAQAKIELIRDDIAANIGPLQATLDCVIAHVDARDDVGLLLIST
jgi:hypothetical protein